jgi:hypothetical protein
MAREGAAPPAETATEAGQAAPGGLPGGDDRPSQARTAPAPPQAETRTAPAPKTEAPKAEPPAAEAKAPAPPVSAEPPAPAGTAPAEAPARPEPPKTEPPKTEPAKTEPAKAAPPKAEPAKTEPTRPAKTPAELAGPYTVCLSSHKEAGAAKAEAARLAAKGVPAQVVAVDLGAKGRWFRVCSGEFKTPAQAQAQAQEWKKQGVSPDPFQARLP